MSTDSQSPLRAGTVLDDRFEIVKLLGKGGLGELYLAWQVVFGRRLRSVALKLLWEAKVSSANVYEVFTDAVHLLSLQEQDPDPQIARHLVEVHDIGLLKAPTPRAFMSMRLVSGEGSLARVIRRYREAGGMPVKASVGYLVVLHGR